MLRNIMLSHFMTLGPFSGVLWMLHSIAGDRDIVAIIGHICGLGACVHMLMTVNKVKRISRKLTTRTPPISRFRVQSSSI